eukprot:1282735-Rhodomonas_salina.1
MINSFDPGLGPQIPSSRVTGLSPNLMIPKSHNLKLSYRLRGQTRNQKEPLGCHSPRRSLRLRRSHSAPTRSH